MSGGHPYFTKVYPFPSGQCKYYTLFSCDRYTILLRKLIAYMQLPSNNACSAIGENRIMRYREIGNERIKNVSSPRVDVRILRITKLFYVCYSRVVTFPSRNLTLYNFFR